MSDHNRTGFDLDQMLSVRLKQVRAEQFRAGVSSREGIRRSISERIRRRRRNQFGGGALATLCLAAALLAAPMSTEERNFTRVPALAVATVEGSPDAWVEARAREQGRPTDERLSHPPLVDTLGSFTDERGRA